MTIRDASLLAYTKFKTRKARSVLTVMGSAFLVAILLFITTAGTGLKNNVGDINNKTKDLHLTFQQYGGYGSVPEKTGDTDESVEKQIDTYKNSVKQSGIEPKDIYVSFEGSTTFTLEGFDQSVNSNGGLYISNYISVLSNTMVEAYVYDGQNIDWVQGGSVPILLDYDYLKALHKDELGGIKDVVARAKKLQSYAEEVIGKDRKMTLSVQNFKVVKNTDGSEYSELADAENVDINVRIVGFKPSSSSFFSSISGMYSFSGVQIPLNVAEQIPELKSVITTPNSYFASFSSISDRDAYLKYSKDHDNYMAAQAYGDLNESVKSFTGTINSIFKGVIIVMLLFVTLPTMGTLSKVLADSRRETGVFRAIGAKNRDMLQIYMSYSIIMATLAFIIALLIATGICMWLTASKGAELGASLAEFSGDVQVKTIVLFGVNILHWLFLYGVLVASAILGAIIPVLRELRRDPISAMRDE